MISRSTTKTWGEALILWGVAFLVFYGVLTVQPMKGTLPGLPIFSATIVTLVFLTIRAFRKRVA